MARFRKPKTLAQAADFLSQVMGGQDVNVSFAVWVEYQGRAKIERTLYTSSAYRFTTGKCETVLNAQGHTLDELMHDALAKIMLRPEFAPALEQLNKPSRSRTVRPKQVRLRAPQPERLSNAEPIRRLTVKQPAIAVRRNGS